jgi:hypothetical protein
MRAVSSTRRWSWTMVRLPLAERFVVLAVFDLALVDAARVQIDLRDRRRLRVRRAGEQR